MDNMNNIDNNDDLENILFSYLLLLGDLINVY